MRSRHHSTSSDPRASLGSTPVCGSTAATTTSPHSSSGWPTTPTSPTARRVIGEASGGWDESAPAFGRGVVLPHDLTEPVHQALLHVDRTWCGAVEYEDERRDVVARLHVVGQREQTMEHRRHHVRMGDSVCLDE